MPRPTTILLLPADKPKISQLIFFLLGCLTTLAFAPFGLSLVVPLVLVPFLYVCLTNSPQDSAKHGFWFGFGLFLSGTYWIYISVHVFGNAALWIALPQAGCPNGWAQNSRDVSMASHDSVFLSL